MKDVAKLRGLHLRGNVYYSRIVVPKALVARFGRPQVWKSLGTSRRSEAEALHLREASHWAAAFAEAERTVCSVPRAEQPLSDAEVAELAGTFFARSKSALDLRGDSPAVLDDHEREQVREDLQQQLATLGTCRQ